jgi:alpha-1,6-mannosyltransferase
MEGFRWRQLIRFSIALVAQILLCASWNWFDDWTIPEMPVKFVAAGMQCGLAYLIAIREFPVNASPRLQAGIFWGGVIALRLVALPLEPGDDFWRYQWEGKIQQAGLNPYALAPDDPKIEAIHAQFPAFHKINPHNFRVSYPPGAELIFSGLSRISDNPLFYKLLFSAADLVAIALLLRLFGDAARYVNAAWYAWNPLVVYCFAGAAQFDSLMILPLIAGILFLSRIETEPDSRRKWWLALAASAAFGIAISINLVPALLLLVCAFALRARAITLVVSLGIPGLLSLCYGYPKIPVWDSLLRSTHVVRLNDLFWWAIEETVWPNPHQRNYHYDVVIVVCVALVSLLFQRNWKRGMLWALGTALILSPVFHPWYCTWILPLAAWRRSLTWYVLSLTLFAYFLFWDVRLFLLAWHAELWLRAIILVPPLAVAILFGFTREKPAISEASSA